MHYQRPATIAPSTAWCIRLCSVHKLFRNVSSSRSGCLRQTTMRTRHRMAKQTSRRNRRQEKRTKKLLQKMFTVWPLLLCVQWCEQYPLQLVMPKQSINAFETKREFEKISFDSLLFISLFFSFLLGVATSPFDGGARELVLFQFRFFLLFASATSANERYMLHYFITHWISH